MEKGIGQRTRAHLRHPDMWQHIGAEFPGRCWWLFIAPFSLSLPLSPPPLLRVLWLLTSNFNDLCNSGGEHGRSGKKPPHGASSAWWVILPWRLGTVHEFAGRRNSGSGHEKGVRCRPGSLALKVGQLLVIRTFWVAISLVSRVAQTFSTAQQL